MQKKTPDLFNHFVEIGIEPQMFTTEWILDLFSHIIPINMYGKFLDNFISDGSQQPNELHGWEFFYQIVITILKFLESDLMQL